MKSPESHVIADIAVIGRALTAKGAKDATAGDDIYCSFAVFASFAVNSFSDSARFRR
jgi:hypothetical protein